MDLKLKNYSSGMQVRLAFAVMVQVDADVLLIDEILAVGDAAFQQKCFDVFFRLRDEGKTIVLVTHDMAAVTRFCHRAVLLEEGRVVALGDPPEVADRYMEMNFEPGSTSDPAAFGGQRAGDGSARVLEAWIEDDKGQRSDGDSSGHPLRLQGPRAFPRGAARPGVLGGLRQLRAPEHVRRQRPDGHFAPGDEAVVGVTLPQRTRAGPVRAVEHDHPPRRRPRPHRPRWRTSPTSWSPGRSPAAGWWTWPTTSRSSGSRHERPP